jgi:hypothetical protein
VPLLRPGFRPSGAYYVSFVYLHAGTPFDKKGDIEMTLPRMDMPIGIVEWELFAPDRYSVRSIGGNAIETNMMRVSDGSDRKADRLDYSGPKGRVSEEITSGGAVGQISGIARDTSGAILPGVTIEITSPAFTEGIRTTTTDGKGRFVFTDVPAGRLSVAAKLPGFGVARHDFVFDQRPRELTIEMRVGSIEETVTVSADRPIVDTQSATRTMVFTNEPAAEPPLRQRNDPASVPQVSQNVVQLQRRTTGVLPVRVDVPRAGTSYQFVKPLVVDQETTVKLRYKRR